MTQQNLSSHPREYFLMANGLRHHLLEWDGGGRTTVLCLHGFLDLAWGFYPIAPRLAEAGFHVVAPDFRGHGDTEHIGPGGYYHFADYIFDVADLVDALARDSLVIIGHSMGGMVASYYAGTFPERVERLVLMEGLGAPEPPIEDLPERAARWIRSVRKARSRELRTYPSIEAAAERLREVDPRCPRELALLFAEHGTRSTPEGRVFKHDPVHLTQGPYPFRLDAARAFWRNVSCPVLMVEGKESVFLQIPDLEKRYANFREYRRVEIEGAGHMMIRHNPEAVAEAILAFLQS